MGYGQAFGKKIQQREAWILNGFESKTQDEETMLQEERQTLGFNPCEGAHMLTAKSDSAKGSAKRVLKKLTGKTSKE